MANSIAKKQKDHYDKKTSIYSHEYKRTNYFFRDHYQTFADIITACTKPTDRILEIGCGDGLESEFINRKHIVLTDISLARCGSKRPKYILDVSDLKAVKRFVKKHGPFDAVYESYTLHHLPDIDQGLTNLKLIAPKIILIEPVIWTPQTLLLSMYNIRHEPHFFKMKLSVIRAILAQHFTHISHLHILGRFHYFFALVPNQLAFLFKPLFWLTTFPIANVFVCETTSSKRKP